MSADTKRKRSFVMKKHLKWSAVLLIVICALFTSCDRKTFNKIGDAIFGSDSSSSKSSSPSSSSNSSNTSSSSSTSTSNKDKLANTTWSWYEGSSYLKIYFGENCTFFIDLHNYAWVGSTPFMGNGTYTISGNTVYFKCDNGCSVTGTIVGQSIKISDWVLTGWTNF